MKQIALFVSVLMIAGSVSAFSPVYADFDDRQDRRQERGHSDERQDRRECRRDEGYVGQDKRECKQEEVRDGVRGHRDNDDDYDNDD